MEINRRNVGSVDNGNLLFKPNGNGVVRSQPQGGILKFNRKIGLLLLIGSLCSLYIAYHLHWYLIATNHIADMDFLEVKSCPACFGQSLCPRFFSGEVNFRGHHQYPVFHKYNPRNVFHGQLGLFARTEPVVIKKLGPSDVLDDVDQSICKSTRNTWPKCIPRGAILDLLPRDGNVPLLLKNLVGTSDMMFCPTQRLKDRVMRNFLERASPDREDYLRMDELMLLYTLKVNPQPLMLQTFPSNEGWPFPVYRGACGRWVVEDLAGDPLETFCSADLSYRLRLAVELLHLAQNLSNNTDQFSLYLGDVALENFVVDRRTFKITIVDAENILVVDVKQVRSYKMDAWDHPLTSQFESCTNLSSLPGHIQKEAKATSDGIQSCSFSQTSGMNYSPIFPRAALCNRIEADHNYYSICRWLLSPSYAPAAAVNSHDCPAGLLHGVDLIHPHLSHLLDTCALGETEKAKVDRGQLVKQIIKEMHSVYRQLNKGQEMPIVQRPTLSPLRYNE